MTLTIKQYPAFKNIDKVNNSFTKSIALESFSKSLIINFNESFRSPIDFISVTLFGLKNRFLKKNNFNYLLAKFQNSTIVYLRKSFNISN